jgi:hypothetical protein
MCESGGGVGQNEVLSWGNRGLATRQRSEVCMKRVAGGHILLLVLVFSKRVSFFPVCRRSSNQSHLSRETPHHPMRNPRSRPSWSLQSGRTLNRVLDGMEQAISVARHVFSEINTSLAYLGQRCCYATLRTSNTKTIPPPAVAAPSSRRSVAHAMLSKFWRTAGFYFIGAME